MVEEKNTVPQDGDHLPVRHPWRVAVGALLGLLLAIVVVGLVGVFVNRDIRNAAADALNYDVELEDHGDDLRVAALEVRQQQRTLYFGREGPTRAGISSLENSYLLLREEIDEYDALDVREDDIATPEDIGRLATRYYEDYITAIEDYEEDGDQSDWDAANDLALSRVDEIQLLAAEIDAVGEALSEDSLSRVDREARAGMIAISAVVASLLLVGALLSYSTFRGVNELRALYREQRRFSEELAAAAKAKTDFLADVSHELRTPLTVLRGNAEIGLQLQKDDMQREILSEILAESARMGRLVEDLLFLSRSDASSSMPFEFIPVEVESLMADVSTRAATLARERSATLETDLKAAGIFDLDPERIEQTVIILVDNAAKYAGSGGPISLKTTNTDSELSIEVKDSGSGIPESELEKVFERFHRLDKARSRTLGGTGLGLPIARTIVEAHGGTISASSAPGEGTLMSVKIPDVPRNGFSE